MRVAIIPTFNIAAVTLSNDDLQGGAIAIGNDRVCCVEVFVRVCGPAVSATETSSPAMYQRGAKAAWKMFLQA
jgi:hypothetical protein